MCLVFFFFVFIDIDYRRFSIRGSNTSISSLGSCGFENVFVFFIINLEEDVYFFNG